MENKQGESKKIMTEAIKNFVVPEIYKLGFSGTFPHFRREGSARFEFFSFQFNRYGGSFVLECGFITPQDLPDFAKNLPFEKLTYGHTHSNNRLRIKPEVSAMDDFWFTYSEFKEEIQFENLAKSLIPLLPKVDSFFKK